MISKMKKKLTRMWRKMQGHRKLRYIRKHYSLNIMNIEDTIAYIKEHNCSVTRFGDGELSIMLQKNAPPFQKGSAALAADMKRTIQAASSDLLVCMPGGFISVADYSDHGKKFWNIWSLSSQQEAVTAIRNMVPKDYVFGDSFLSRPFSPYKSAKPAEKIFPLLKELWADQDVLFIEGTHTRLGIGNDLFNNVKSIKRILCPAENAYDVYDQILKTAVSHWNGELVILALGPTATVLAADLSQKGIRTLDLGHVDIQYEWFLSGKKFVPIEGKYTHEAQHGRNNTSDCNDSAYLSQIIASVES